MAERSRGRRRPGRDPGARQHPLADGPIHLHLFSALAQLEREQIAERTSGAMLRHQAKGRRMTRPDRCPYGWRPDPSDPDRLIEDADEQATVRRIREERRHGRGLREIARRLDVAGIGCRGGRWSHTTVRSILLRFAPLAKRGWRIRMKEKASRRRARYPITSVEPLNGGTRKVYSWPRPAATNMVTSTAPTYHQRDALPRPSRRRRPAAPTRLRTARRARRRRGPATGRRDVAGERLQIVRQDRDRLTWLPGPE